MRNISLRWKITALVSAAALLLVLVGVVYLSAQYRDEEMKNARDDARRTAELTSFTVSPSLLFRDRVSAQDAISAVCRSIDVASLEVIDSSGKPFVTCIGAVTVAEGRVTESVPVRSGDAEIGTLRLTYSLDPAMKEIDTRRRWLAGLGLFTLIAGTVLALAIGSFVTRPLEAMTVVAEAVRAGDLHRRAPAKSHDEVGTLARTFNHMLDEIEQLNQRLEQLVEQRTRELSSLLQSAYDGILSIDADGHCTLLNRAGGAVLGLEPIEVLGRNGHELLHPGCAREHCSLLVLLQSRRPRQVKETFLRADGTAVAVNATIAPMRDGDRITGTVMTFHDVTERDELQRQLEEATRLSSLGTLATKVAHEFNNVLMGILPFVELVGREAPSNPRIAKWCERMVQTINRGKRITQAVLSFTRPQVPKRQALSVATWLDEFAPALRDTAGKAVLNILPPDSGLVIEADRGQLQQLLTNLISNARDAMPNGGTIEVSVVRDGNRACLSVRDEGAGMQPEVASRLFEPFFTTKNLFGTGLGLPIAEQIARAHGGTIAVTTAPGRGSTFEVRLPISGEAEAVPPVALPAASGTFRGHVLLVEDDAAVASGVQTLLEEQQGIEVGVAFTGRSALAMLRASVPDAVILDIGLPDMDGLALYRTIAEAQPEMPVIFSTAHGDAAAIVRALNRKNVRFLLKPYPAEALLAALSELVIPGASDPSRSDH